MKKPKLNKVDPTSIHRACGELQEFITNGAWNDYKSSAQLLIDRYIPAGWRLDIDDIDLEAFDGRIDHINRTLFAIDDLSTCYVSRTSLLVTEAIKRIVVRNFTRWLSEQFKKFGKEAK